MRIAIGAGGGFGIPAFARLQADGHELVLLVGPPPRRAGRGNLAVPAPAPAWAEGAGVPVYLTENLNEPEPLAALRAAEADLFLVADFGQILGPAALTAARRGAVNLHGSLLPKYRGAEPVRRAILAGETETGVTFITMDERIDTGAILARRACPLLPDDDYGTLKTKLAALAAELATETLTRYAAGELAGEPQDNAGATPAPKLRKEERVLDWSRPAGDLARLVRALAPEPGAYTTRGGKRLLIWKSRPAPGAGRPGAVLTPAPLTVACGDGALAIACLQPEGKQEMTADEFARGYRPRPGEIWGAAA